MKKFLILLACLATSLPAAASELSMEALVEATMNGGHRSEENIARNRYRHPVGTLQFLGLEKGMTVMEIWPGGGWYTEVLAPAMRGHGKYIAAGWDLAVPDQPGYRARLQNGMLQTFADNPELYGEVGFVEYSPPQSASLGNANSIDLVLTFRNTHGWIGGGIADAVYAEFARVLKPGGILGVVQHRAADGTDPAETRKAGYVSEEAIIAMAEAAGLVLEARSEVNANPADSRDHAKGVWSLPPGLAVCRDIEDAEEKAGCEEKFRAIGESDRMTLKFRKPKD